MQNRGQPAGQLVPTSIPPTRNRADQPETSTGLISTPRAIVATTRTPVLSNVEYTVPSAALQADGRGVHQHTELSEARPLPADQ
jgi:hypothetical protein